MGIEEEENRTVSPSERPTEAEAIHENLRDAGRNFHAAFPDEPRLFETAEEELGALEEAQRKIDAMETKAESTQESRAEFIRKFNDGAEQVKRGSHFDTDIRRLSGFLERVGGMPGQAGETGGGEAHDADQRKIAEAATGEILTEAQTALRDGNTIVTYGEALTIATERAKLARMKEKGVETLSMIETLKLKAQTGISFAFENKMQTLQAIKAAANLYRQFERIKGGV